jgi:hypothetical protein
VEIINLFYLTLCDDIFEWGENVMQSHPNCVFDELEVFFTNTIERLKKRTSLHGALHVIKQKVDEKVDV